MKKPEIITRQYGITKNGVSYTVEVRIDMDALATDMVNNAARNSSGKATQMFGTIIAKVIGKSADQGEKA